MRLQAICWTIGLVATPVLFAQGPLNPAIVGPRTNQPFEASPALEPLPISPSTVPSPPGTLGPMPTPPLNSSERAPETAPVEIVGTDLSAAALPQFETISIENHPEIQAARQAVSSAVGRAIQAGLYPNPFFQGGAIQWGGQETFWGANFTQEVVVARKLYLQRQAEYQAVRQAEQDLARVRYQVLRDVRAGFYVTLALQIRVDALTQLVAIAKKSFESGQRLKLGGEGTLTDELQLKIQYRRAMAGMAAADAQLKASKNTLAALTGVPDLRIDRLEGSLSDSLPNMEYPLVRAGVLAENANIRRAAIEINRRRFLLRRAIVQPIPNPLIQAGYQYYVGGYGNTPAGSSENLGIQNLPILMVTFPVPVFDRNQGAVREARAEVSRASLLLRDTQNDLSARAADALGRLDASSELVAEYEKEILPAAKQTVELAQAAYQGGQFSLLQLLQAQRDLVDAYLGSIDAQSQRWVAAVDIAQLLQLESFPPAP
jgi:cobalt-zinc-cadmium efflux system outer membrane protein